MGLHYHLNYLVIIFLVHVIVHCVAFDLINNNFFRRPQHGQIRRDKYKYSLSNANEKPDLYNKTKASRHYLQWKWKRAGSDVYNNEDGNNFLKNQKADINMHTTTAPLLKASYTPLISRYMSKSTTPSYIEFDYLDENQDQYASSKTLDQLGTDNGITKLVNYKTSRPVIVHPSIVSYHVFNDPYNRQDMITPPKPIFTKTRHESLLYPYFQPDNNFPMNTRDKSTNKISLSDLIRNIPIFGQNAVTVKLYSKQARVTTPKNVTTLKLLLKSTTLALQLVSTTPDDKVKFFEIYDNNTLKPSIDRTKLNENSEIESRFTDMTENMSLIADHNNNCKLRSSENTNKTNIDEKSEIESNLTGIRSEKMIQMSDHNNGKLKRFDNTNKTKIEKKHNYKKRSFIEQRNSAISNQIKGKSVPKLLTHSIANTTFMFQSENIFSKSIIMTKTAVVPWSSYPFASVYVYKPTQTHCDAAGISPHWLLAAGSCLSRQTLVHSLHARSAFVTYCGEHWRRPERVAYVKRSVVHPKFNPRDKIRRLLYNIGLIQVSDSMAASCPRWSPVVMMSHQFSTQPGGSLASAVGWGLDRYGTKYVTEKLSHWPLTVYDALVYCDTCPGSTEYREKNQDGDDASNVYCLLLPPYTKEESDPVHGALLLVEGKLVALYIQEERRSQGPQSAQYTGVWRLLPWVMDIAREPDDVEATFDI